MKRLTPFLFMAFFLGLTSCNKEEGCTYPNACNYNADALVDDGSCDYASCSGCTDPGALNYNASAESDNGDCIYDPSVSTAVCESSVEFDSYSYPIVAIGGQCWFAENLRTAVFQDGSEIPYELGSDFPNLATPARTNYNGSEFNYNSYGHLYNGFAATTSIHGGICPTGWHVPTELDWIEMESFLFAAGHGERMGAVLKSTESWTGNGDGEDLFGFGGIGGGHAWPDGSFYSRNVWGAYWSSTETEASPVSANYRQIGSSTDQMANGSYWSVTGCSVRCVED